MRLGHLLQLPSGASRALSLRVLRVAQVACHVGKLALCHGVLGLIVVAVRNIVLRDVTFLHLDSIIWQRRWLVLVRWRIQQLADCAWRDTAAEWMPGADCHEEIVSPVVEEVLHRRKVGPFWLVFGACSRFLQLPARDRSVGANFASFQVCLSWSDGNEDLFLL